MSTKLIKSTAKILVAVMFLWGIAPRIEAGFSPSELVAMQQTDRAVDIAKIQKALESKMVTERLEALGFTQGEIKTRLDKLSDQELHQIALKVDELKAGGDGLGVVIAILVIAILVVILLKLTGHKIEVKKE
ncbi:MAG: PA2779 family protein [Acidobacteriota bacterium]